MANSYRKLSIAFAGVAVVIAGLEVGTAILDGRALNVLLLLAMTLLVVWMVLRLRGVVR